MFLHDLQIIQSRALVRAGWGLGASEVGFSPPPSGFLGDRQKENRERNRKSIITVSLPPPPRMKISTKVMKRSERIIYVNMPFIKSKYVCVDMLLLNPIKLST